MSAEVFLAAFIGGVCGAWIGITMIVFFRMKERDSDDDDGFDR